MGLAQRLCFYSALLIVIFELTAGCRAIPPFPSPPAATPASGTLDLVLWHSETGAARDTLEALARDFHAAYPTVTVTPLYVGGADDLEKQVTAAIALNRTPDLVLARRSDIAAFARQGGLLSLEPFLADPSTGLYAQDRADIFPGILDEGRLAEMGKQVYAFPFSLEALVLFYNADLLQAASFDKPPANWADWADAASKVTRDEDYGWPIELRADVFAAMLVSQGSAMVDMPEHRSLFAERGGVAAMTLASQLTKSGAAHVKGGAGSGLDDFVQGRAAFYLEWMSRLPDIERAQAKSGTKFEIGLANLPQADPAEPFALIRGKDLALFRMPPERASQAWFFIRWLTASPQSARWVSAVDTLPLRASVLGLLSTDTPNGIQLRAIENALGGKAPYFIPLPSHRNALEIERLMENAWSQIVLAKADIASTLTAASSSADQLLSGNR